MWQLLRLQPLLRRHASPKPCRVVELGIVTVLKALGVQQWLVHLEQSQSQFWVGLAVGGKYRSCPDVSKVCLYVLHGARKHKLFMGNRALPEQFAHSWCSHLS